MWRWWRASDRAPHTLAAMMRKGLPLDMRLPSLRTPLEEMLEASRTPRTIRTIAALVDAGALKRSTRWPTQQIDKLPARFRSAVTKIFNDVRRWTTGPLPF
jgi:hypothetical protein